MKNLRKSIIRGTSILGLIMSAASSSSAMNSSVNSGINPSVSAWRIIARKNFIEGFCVAQTLNAQQVVIQPNQQVDQATVNAFKNAVSVCKQSKNIGVSAPAPSPKPTPIAN